MRPRTLALAAVLATTAGFAACSNEPTAPGLRVQLGEQSVRESKGRKLGLRKPERAALLTNVPVSGPLSDGGSFVGTFTAQHLALDEATRTLVWTGHLTGTATTADGATTVISQVVTAAGALTREASDAALVRPVAMQATCDILFLDLGPISLDLLGLTLDLSQVILDLNAVSGAGNLLGNLLCAVVGLLDGFGLLAAITQLLDSINAILAGLGGVAGASATGPQGPPFDPSWQLHI